jgi:hypothetical protein
MSDTPQATDWWLASDGKWYPPTSRPAPPAPPPPPPAPPSYGAPPYGVPSPPGQSPSWQYQPPPGYVPAPTRLATVPTALSGWLQGLLWTAGGVAVVGTILGLAGIGTFNALFDSSSYASYSDYDRWNSIDKAFRAFFGFEFLVGIAIFILTVIWAFKANRASNRLRPGLRTWGAGWTIGAWFIPVANAILPKLVLDETERIATAPRTNQQVGADWHHTRSSVLGWLWWIALVVSILALNVGGQFDQSQKISGSRGMENAYYVILLFGFIGHALAAVLGVFYVRRVSRPLSPIALAGTP